MHALRAPVAFDGARFLDGGATLLLDGERIAGVESFGHAVPHDCEVTTYDGTLLPGLVDAHVHLVADASVGSLERAGQLGSDALDTVIRDSLCRQLAAGVTTVRDLGDADFRTLAFRELPGLPRVVASGPPLTVPEGHCHYLGGVVAGAEAIRAAIGERADRGVDVVKVMASGGMLTLGSDVMGVQFSAADLRTLVESAHAADLQVLAHAHSLPGIVHALEAGVDGIEHFTGITEEGVRLPDELLERVAAAGVVVDPTMGNDNAVLDQLPQPPPHILAVMTRLGLDLETFFAERYVQVGRLRAHGVRVVSGVDAGAAPPKAHGNAWRAVLDLVTAGYPVAEALAASTGLAADACGLGEVTGRLAPGLAADVLVADGDLRSDPAGLGRPQAVLARGTRY